MKGAAIRTLFQLYLSDEPLTTTDLAKEVFDGDDIQNADRKIRYYLTDKFDHIVDTNQSNGSTHFTLQEDSVFFGEARIEVLTQIGGQVVGLDGELADGEDFEEVSLAMGPVMIVQDADSGYSVVSLELSEKE